MDNKQFKFDLEEILIPRIRLMITKEEDHLQFLKSKPRYVPEKIIEEFTDNSNKALQQLKKRLEEYINYAKELQ